MQNYGERTCLECGKKFVATKITDIVCSPECKKKRQRRQSKDCREKHISERAAKLQELNDKIAAQAAEIEKLTLQVGQLEAANTELADRLSKTSGDGLQLSQCLRTTLKALHLPCGQNSLCWEGEPCEKCKDMEKPNFEKWNKQNLAPTKGKTEDSYFERYRTVAE